MSNWKFAKNEKGEVVFFKIPSFEESGLVKHCFTTRLGGISKAPYLSLNLGTKTEDNKKDIYINYEIICNTLDIDIGNLVLSDQVHKDNIMIVSQEHRGNGVITDNKLSEIDGLITNNKNVALVTLYADCVPIFILDKKRKIIALAHGGWRGTVKKIGKKVIEKMSSDFNSDPKDCIVGIGPSIGNCCYEVDDYVVSKFKENYDNVNEFIKDKGDEKYLLDLWTANKISLIEAGIPDENITVSNICTKCNNDLFFSYRAEDGKTGRMAAILQLI
ncbi:peptidoglycan editing factor PgeF [Wukongibacter baidiensis]|uniref:peptidoglycan editing factor PgeF n=1 Tax=Wukongibacter baidiensis TaxID=1723361 RepID=UPI003D7F57E1